MLPWKLFPWNSVNLATCLMQLFFFLNSLFTKQKIDSTLYKMFYGPCYANLHQKITYHSAVKRCARGPKIQLIIYNVEKYKYQKRICNRRWSCVHCPVASFICILLQALIIHVCTCIIIFANLRPSLIFGGSHTHADSGLWIRTMVYHRYRGLTMQNLYDTCWQQIFNLIYKYMYIHVAIVDHCNTNNKLSTFGNLVSQYLNF